MATEASTWVGRTLIGSDGSRLGPITEVFVDDDGEDWLRVQALRGTKGFLEVPARVTTERGVKDIVTWLDDAAMVSTRTSPRGRGSEPEPEPEPVAAPVAPGPAPKAAAARKAPAARRSGTNLTEIKGLGPDHAATLVSAGVRTIAALLRDGGSPAGRRALASQTGIDGATILEWVNRADLMRIRGVGAEYSDLLESSGVDTVRELSKRKPANLEARMAELNGQLHLVRRTPSLREVERWVAEAKELPVAVTY